MVYTDARGLFRQRHFCCGMRYGDLIHCFVGCDGGTLSYNTLDMRQRTWSGYTTTQFGNRDNFGYVQIGSKMYILGGEPHSHGGHILKSFLMFDAVTTSWIQLPDMPKALAECTAVHIGPYIVVMGGRGNDRMSDEVFIFRLDTHQWFKTDDKLYIYYGNQAFLMNQ